MSRTIAEYIAEAMENMNGLKDMQCAFRLLEMAELLAKKKDWIAVKDELPDAEITVLMANNAWDDPVCEGFLDGNFWVRTTDTTKALDGLDSWGVDDEQMVEPTRWMPLPEPPFVASVSPCEKTERPAK